MDRDQRPRGLWDITAPALSLPVLEETVNADVAVVGAGFTGLSAALHLADFGAQVVVLEAEDVGAGASGRNVGLVNAGLWIRPSQIHERLGSVYAERLIESLGNAPSLVFDLVARYRIECEATRQGTLHCAFGSAGARELAERCRQWQARGAPVQLLGGADTRALVGSSAFRASLLDRRAGTIQPLAYARGLAAAAQSMGARIFISSSVQSAEEESGVWHLRTPRGSVRAPQLVVTTNTYSRAPFRGIAEEQVRLPYFNFATKPLNEAQLREVLPQKHGIWDSNRILSSARLDRAGRLIFGSIGALAGIDGKIHHDWACRAVQRLFPQLDDVEFDHAWFGWIGTTADAVPRFHRLGRDSFAMGGYNGRGIAPGTHFGKELAQLVAGRTGIEALSLPLTELSGAPLRALRELYYRSGAAAAHWAAARFAKE